MVIKNFTGLFLVLFLVSAFTGSAYTVWQIKHQANNANFVALINGQWSQLFEGQFDKTLPVYDLSKLVWGTLNYTFFQEGKEGVLVGKDGWLFTKEEFDYYPKEPQEIVDKVAYVSRVSSLLKDKGINLLVVVLPGKARVYENKLGRFHYPEYKQDVYTHFIEALQDNNIAVVNVLDDMISRRQEKLFLKTDTHWTPRGAQIVAQKVAEHMKLTSMDASYETKKREVIAHEGDLMLYIPVVGWSKKPQPDMLDVMITEASYSEEVLSAESLFDDAEIPVTLVGTSYSANKLWNFEGYLKQYLKADVLNAADEGLGPFEVMDSYLASGMIETTPPELVVWEIPERYLPVSYDLKF